MYVPVSVVVPCYCCEDTIERAVVSVMSQTALPGEVILVDDASPDHGRTLSKLQELQERFRDKTHIEIIALKNNSGPSVARNAGWGTATQPYIAFLDADDAWHPQKLEIQYGYMCNFPDVVMTGHDWIVRRRDDSFVDDILPQKWKIKCISKWRFILISKYFITPTVMVKRSVVHRFPCDLRYAEDRFLWLEIISDNNKAAYIDLPLTYLFKAPYGDAGLTRNIFAMEKGELVGFTRLYDMKLINLIEFTIGFSFSLIKFIRRFVKVTIRRISNTSWSHIESF